MIERDQVYIREASSRANEPPDSKILSALAEAQTFADTLIAPVGRCLSTIAEQTGDTDFIRTSLALILPPITDITWPSHRDDDEFAETSAAAFLKLMHKLFVFAHSHAFRLKAEASPHYANGAVQLEVACQGLAYGLCSDKDWPSTQRVILDLAKETSPSKLFSVSGDELERCSRDHDNWVLRAKIREYLRKLVKTEGFKSRPYMAITTASILAQLGQTDTALLQLENWVALNRKSRTPTNAIQSKWLEVRAINAMTVLTENWIRREGPNASIVMRTFHINRLDEALNVADELFGARSAISAFSNGITSEKLESLAFSIGPPDSGSCTGKPTAISDQKQQVTFFTWYLAARASAAHHSLLHPNYAKRYMHLVNKTVRDLLDTNFGCTVEATTRTQFRADTLRLYANMQHADATAMRAMKTREALEKQLRSGLSAAELGIRMLIADAEREIGIKADIKTPTPILERLSNSETIETYESLLGARAQLLNALQQLD